VRLLRVTEQVVFSQRTSVRKRLSSIIVVAMVVFLLPLAGCGRNTSVASHQSGHRQSKTTPVIGDTAEHSLTTTTSIADQSPIAGHGQRKCTITDSANHGRSIPSHIIKTFDFREDTENQVGTRSKQRTFITWFGLDAEGNCYLLGESEDGMTWDVVTDAAPPMYMPSKLNVGASWSYTAHFASGATESVASTCVGMERVKTPSGGFQAYKLNSRIERKGANISGYIWVSPDAPLVFEVAADINVSTDVYGIPGTTHTIYQLTRLNLAR
jgi:hypothetical protein